jgi:predicted GH43/DUF377 family glycosyl hydrolase
VDWGPEAEWEPVDPRVVKRKADGLVRLTFSSHLRVARCKGGRRVVDVSGHVFTPEASWEEYGVEDPRITRIEDRYWITYVAVSRHGPATALASTENFRQFTRHGVIFCPENKDVVLFPSSRRETRWALHRPVCGTPFTRPEMWLAQSPDGIHWGSHEPLRLAGREWRSGRVGAGAPPLRTSEGWLEIYHGNRHPSRPGDVGMYYGGVILLDAQRPARVIGEASEPILTPETEFERSGFVPNVVFPTGVVEEGNTLLIYYGAADTCTAVAEFSRDELLESLSASPTIPDER